MIMDPVIEVACDYCGKRVRLIISNLDQYLYDDDFVVSHLLKEGWGPSEGVEKCQKCIERENGGAVASVRPPVRAMVLL